MTIEKNDLKVIQIGFNLCGTRTFTHFFKNNGLTTLHWEDGLIAKAIFNNLQQGASLLKGFEEAQVITDMEWLISPHFYFEPYKLFQQLHRENPDAYFVLNSRPRDQWIQSRLKHFDGKYAQEFMETLGIINQKALIQYWKEDWDCHLMRVRKYFDSAKGNFFEFDITIDGAEKMQENIPFDFHNTEWPHIKGKQGW